ncbi:hypothetical protein [Streptomyces sp. NPDC059828]|uniref:hypothetical protein n=1 Tax=Streptomyces sp. NPDC059828 TaxID=3346965 RepID=UPI0036615D19
MPGPVGTVDAYPAGAAARRRGHGLITVKGFSPESGPGNYITLDLAVWRKPLEVDTSG